VFKKETSANIISVGTELTTGIIQDKHGKFISEQLDNFGFSVRGIEILPDDQDVLVPAIRKAVKNSAVVIISGGLGPTSDDITRDAVAEAAARKLVFSDAIWEMLKKFFKDREPAESNRKQAFIPENFFLMPNKNGTAPGFWGSVEGANIIVLPGPPKELIPMFLEHVTPLLNKWMLKRKHEILWGTSICIPESKLEVLLKENSAAGVTWGTRIEPFRIIFHLKGNNREILEKSFSSLMNSGRDLFIRKGVYDPALELVTALKERKYTLAGAESCTGGYISKLITDIPGSSAVFWGGFIVYSNKAKVQLGVDSDILGKYGAVSGEAVQALTHKVLEKTGADTAYAVSGIAGPDGGTPDKPVGTVWISFQVKNGDRFLRSFTFHGSRDAVRRKSGSAVLLLLKALIEENQLLDSEEIWQYI